ncbi:MAG: hypothetical protein WC601_08920 [Desulfotomaculaceae bacterium]
MTAVKNLLVLVVEKSKAQISVVQAAIIFVTIVMVKAETIMGYTDKAPMLGCENAWIAAVALMAALKNEGTIKITYYQIKKRLKGWRFLFFMP